MNLVELLAPQGAEIYKMPKSDNRFMRITEYGITKRDMPCYQIRMHSSISCLQYVRYGSGIIIANNHMYQIHAGDTFLLREGIDQIYYSNPDNQFERIWINFRGEFSKSVMQLYGIQDFIVFQNTDTEPLLQDIFSICKANFPAEVYQDKIEQKFLEIAQFLSKNKKELPQIDTNVEKIRLYIDHHVKENIKLSDISNAFSFTREYLVRMFKKNYSITPHQYIIQSKIRIAMIMLKEGEKSIEEISDILSFSAPQHFSSTFFKYTGYRPSAYKKNHSIAIKSI